MKYVYHMVPKTMAGNNLISLNNLRILNEELYKEYTKKYFNHPERPKLLERRIPKINCLWNDVIHFLPLHPHLVYSALQKLDINVNKDLTFYKIPSKSLINNKNAVYLYRKENYKGPAVEMNVEDIQIIDIEKFKELTKVPKDTVYYFEEEHKKGARFGLFAFIPHILSLGEVNISDAEIINWSDKFN
ncbi:group-specific protein [Sporosarcina sp. ANT_H38]|uniref:group-specific protein n=1 Tax=Sporosarcina sp. ANT_H38 TaxID=2597358 RepID=UPI0011F1425D|nr:group-specific protein [Sporosarcina sp. ANT_H38]KAA0955794.1 group-specific protein [Sporosarcina sp. ANT_H38]